MRASARAARREWMGRGGWEGYSSPTSGGAKDNLPGGATTGSAVGKGPPFPAEARQPGPDPERTSYGSFCSFNDPDGNLWLVQEVTTRHPGRMDPTETAFASAEDLENALWRAEAAHVEHHKRAGRSHLLRSSKDEN